MKINKQQLLKASLVIQIGVGVFALMSGILSFINQDLALITQRLIGATLLISAINNQLFHKKMGITIIYIIFGFSFLAMGII